MALSMERALRMSDNSNALPDVNRAHWTNIQPITWSGGSDSQTITHVSLWSANAPVYDEDDFYDEEEDVEYVEQALQSGQRFETTVNFGNIDPQMYRILTGFEVYSEAWE
jgi:hypothetical protein